MPLRIAKAIGSLFKSDLVEDIFEGVDKLTTTQEEKMTIRKHIADAVQNYHVNLEREYTARHSNDMKSDSWLSKNIRPLTLLAGILMFLIFGILNAIYDRQLNAGMTEILGTMLSSVVFFYFGSRGIEKITSLVTTTIDKKNKLKQDCETK